MLHQASVEQGRVPLVRTCYLGRHVTDRPSVTWCRRCARIVIRGMGAWWE